MKLFNVLVDKGASRYGSSPCVSLFSDNGIQVLTFRSAGRAAREIGKELKQHPADVVAFLCGNSTDYFLAIIASTQLPSQTALLNTRWTSSEMAAVLRSENSDTKTLVVFDAVFEAQANQLATKLRHRVELLLLPQYSMKYMVGTHAAVPLDPDVARVDERTIALDSSDDKDAVIVFTSGTTGGSKGVRLSHRALLSQALVKDGPPCDYSPSTKMLGTTVPLFHVGGLCSTLALWLAGGTWMLPKQSTSSSAFNPSLVLKSVEQPSLAVNTLVLVPAMIHAILREADNQPSSKFYDKVQLVLIGGQSSSETALVRLQNLFPSAQFIQTYACTEATSSMTFINVTPRQLKSPLTIQLPNDGPVGDLVGPPSPRVILRLFEKKGDAIVIVEEPFKVGVFGISGPHRMNGYWKRGAKVQERAPSWIMTNDLGFQDEKGQFYFCGRRRDSIRTGGETVMAAEVEKLLVKHSAIEECAVFALPDEKFGETVAVAIANGKQQKPTLKEIRRFCKQEGLAGYKQPRCVFYVNELPRNSSGKIVKYRLVQQFRTTQKSKL